MVSLLFFISIFVASSSSSSTNVIFATAFFLLWNLFVINFNFRQNFDFAFLFVRERYFDFLAAFLALEVNAFDLKWRCPLIGRRVHCEDFLYCGPNVAGNFIAGTRHSTVSNWIFKLVAFGGGKPVFEPLFHLRPVDAVESRPPYDVLDKLLYFDGLR